MPQYPTEERISYPGGKITREDCISEVQKIENNLRDVILNQIGRAEGCIKTLESISELL